MNKKDKLKLIWTLQEDFKWAVSQLETIKVAVSPSVDLDDVHGLFYRLIEPMNRLEQLIDPNEFEE